MALRPAKCYKKWERPNTRQSKSVPKKSYVKGVPFPKITRFEIGNKKGKFDVEVYLVSKKEVQIRSNALEAMRVAANKILSKEIGDVNYFMKVLIYPFHVLRENALATGAGADRYQSGMSQAFGKPIGTAARVKKDQNIMRVSVNKEYVDVAKRALKVAGSKLPTPVKIIERQ